MASYYLCPFASFLQCLNDAGQVQPGLLIWTYAAGTSNPTATWTDITGAVPNSNPIQLNAAGRLPNVSIWQLGGVPIKLQFSTNAGTVLAPLFGQQIGPTFDQVSGIDDPTSVFATLASPASGAGVDLVANAVKSYDTFASVRAAAVPVLAPGQTLVIDSEGASVSTDTGGGLFYWDATSNATDDGTTVLKPTAETGAGRYLRQKQSGFSGTVSMTVGEYAAVATAVFYVVGNVATIRIPQVNGTSTVNSFGASFSVTGLGINLSPFAAQFINLSAMEDNTAGIYAQVGTIAPANLGIVALQFYKNGSLTGWTNSGTKGISDGSGGQYSVSFSYLLS